MRKIINISEPKHTIPLDRVKGKKYYGVSDIGFGEDAKGFLITIDDRTLLVDQCLVPFWWKHIAMLGAIRELVKQGHTVFEFDSYSALFNWLKD